MIILILIMSVFLFVFPKSVYAYIDPGSGSYLTQVILGVIFGGLFMLKVYWRKIKNVFSKGSSKKNDEKLSKNE
ncbi:hypothetical protein A2865_02010 [Candidatus Woesebacteria bacterium RIFCSPHIGHO2_01_FULL_39_17]|uniref:Uncharacterized protein n=1 Tax=Candidatus Woesebacteria bacterium RIFCSPLOWO2_01_FULL_39_14 TaxID=1802518 RepID=A0A1F8BBV2_9BACT|nr:MAG: hypothetical protein US72_C0004G0023 [Microgenomates group bacterium GW2011_GWC1_38_12]OGM23086.1 MAG: hypothetical protein A2865_02010 [Candidatus Woesebacteria bacterium RIFCSPHIGHO2_01_FULL_39_17]OGM61537.1 MAG: hypothetical protein A3A52_04240 [Candidatus Woesebacteria bacterium RIFCSPLOWO2_01_FULL_39_14]